MSAYFFQENFPSLFIGQSHRRCTAPSQERYFSSLSSRVPRSVAVKPNKLFDGKTLIGWKGDIKNTWRIEEGAIVGGSLDKVVPRNEFLRSTRKYSDFELKVTFKLVGDRKQANAGIQFRTKPIPNHHEVSGYQADVGQHYWGAPL